VKPIIERWGRFVELVTNNRRNGSGRTPWLSLRFLFLFIIISAPSIVFANDGNEAAGSEYLHVFALF